MQKFNVVGADVRSAITQKSYRCPGLPSEVPWILGLVGQVTSGNLVLQMRPKITPCFWELGKTKAA